jgi:signal transduction histidine kinase/DNA-binding response OmpR family regulator
MATNLLRLCAVLLLWLGFTFESPGQLRIPESLATDYPALTVESVSRYIDPSQHIAVDSAFTLFQNGFFHNNAVSSPQDTLTQWYALVLRNNDSLSYTLPIRICGEAKRLAAYLSVHPAKGTYTPQLIRPTKTRHLLVYLPPQTQHLLLIRGAFDPSVPPMHLDELILQAPHAVSKDYLFQSAAIFFLSGLLLFLCLLSILSAWFFKEKAFAYFAALMFFFVPYFMLIRNIDFVLTRLFPFISTGVQVTICLSAIIVSAYLFVSSYLGLHTRLPRFNRLYILFSLLVPLYVSLDRMLHPLDVTASNIALGIWLLLTLFPAVHLSLKGVQAGKVFLVSCGLLLATSLLYTLHLIGIFPFPVVAVNGFQIGTLLFSTTLFYDLFKRVASMRNEKRKFEALDSLKSVFFENISHELRTPLTLMVDPIKRIADKLPTNEDKLVLQRAYQNGLRLVDLIDQILELTQLENGRMQLKVQEQNIVPLIKGIAASFASLAETKSVSLEISSSRENISLYVEREKLYKVMQNLLSNAFKYVPEKGSIVLSITEDAEQVYLKIQDNGPGITSGSLPYIFDRFYQADQQEEHYQKGSGIGLALVKELVQLHHGTIEVKSIPHHETSFTICFKKGCAHFEDSQIASSAEPFDLVPPKPLSTATIPSGESLNLKAPLRAQAQVLVVEDHPDVMEYICSHLQAHFNIIRASNGQEGIRKAQQHLPDLVISDVMMPEKDGYTLVQQLKESLLTSHIPIVLLSAKASQQEKLKGLKTKADDYLTKPFDAEELLTRVQNLVEQRYNLRVKFGQEEKPLAHKASLSAVDQTFVMQLEGALEARFADPLFGVEELSAEVGLSKVHLNRKLNALFELSANKLIQQFRLQKAKELLLTKAGNVSEIALQTGFNSTAYFVKCFKERYGNTPGSFLS